MPELPEVETIRRDLERRVVGRRFTGVTIPPDTGKAVPVLKGIDEASVHPILPIPDDYQEYPRCIAEATRLLRLAGVDGPYAIAMGPRYYTGLTQAVGDGGYPVLNVVRKLVDGPLVWAPAVNGAVVVSLRGGDFELTIGTDLSIGYQSHTDTTVRLYLIETMAFRVLTPEAAVALAHRDAKGGKKG